MSLCGLIYRGIFLSTTPPACLFYLHQSLVVWILLTAIHRNGMQILHVYLQNETIQAQPPLVPEENELLRNPPCFLPFDAENSYNGNPPSAAILQSVDFVSSGGEIVRVPSAATFWWMGGIWPGTSHTRSSIQLQWETKRFSMKSLP